MSPPERQQPPGKAAAATTKALGRSSVYDTGDPLVGCARQGSTIVACEEVVARLRAAERDERELGLNGSDLRRNADLKRRVHLEELDAWEQS